MNKLRLSLRLKVTVASRTLDLAVVVKAIGRVAIRAENGGRVTADDNVTCGASERRPGRHITSSPFPGIFLRKPFEA